MNFAWALAELQLGFKVTCVHWKKARFLWLKPAARVEAAWCHDPELKALAEKQDGVPTLNTICAADKDPVSGTWIVTTGWTPAQADLFADDWAPWDDTKNEQSETDKLPKAGSMENCEKLSNAINQLLDKVNKMPQLHATVQPGPNDKELTVTIVEEEPDERIAMTLNVTEVCREAIGCTISNPDGITKSSIGGYSLNDKVED